MKNIIYLIISCLLIVSCGEQEITQFDTVNGQSLIQFETNTSTLEVLIDDEGTVEIPITVSTYSTSQRMVNVEVVPVTDSALEAANANQYSFNGAVSIPPNQLKGNLVVTGMDAGIEVGQNLILQLKVTGANFQNTNIVDEIHTVNIIQICPIPGDYLVGTYILNSPLANIWCSGSQPSFIGDNVQVEVSIGDSPTQRVFEAKYAPGSCEGFNGPYEFVVGLSCEQTSLINTVETNVSCNGGATFIFIVNDPNRVGTYDINDDTQITVNVIDDINASCADFGAPFTNQSFTLTKL